MSKNTLTRHLILFAFSVILINANAQKIYNVNDFGAKGIKSELSTNQIQAAIDACFNDGGGVVYFPPGEYLSGTVILKSNTTLWLEAGATLYGSTNPDDFDYDAVNKDISDVVGFEKNRQPVLIYAQDAKNVSIRGKGRIDAQAKREFRPLEAVDMFIEKETRLAKEAGIKMEMATKLDPVTCMLFLVGCENVLIEDVTLWESCGWTLHLQWCDRVFIRGLYIYSDLEMGANADGIDLDGCSNVCISDCIIETADDAIVLKTTNTHGKSLPCENIVVSNCVLTSSSTALKMGTESHNDFRHILFNNCVIRNSNRGLSIVIRDGGTAENIKFSNITMDLNRRHFNWWGNADPIWLVIKKRKEESRIGRINNITFDNVLAYAQGTAKIEGFDKDHRITDVYLNNVKIYLMPESLPDKRADHILSAHDVKNLSMSNVELLHRSDTDVANWTNALYFNHVVDLSLQGVKTGTINNKKYKPLLIENTENTDIQNCTWK